jgi:hypothetical protein
MSLPAVSMNQSPSGPIHKSFSAQRKLAITSTAWSNGIRVYCTDSENGTGSILERSLDQDTNSPAFDEESRHGWRSSLQNAPGLFIYPSLIRARRCHFRPGLCVLERLVLHIREPLSFKKASKFIGSARSGVIRPRRFAMSRYFIRPTIM